jgi:hypothetical protein
VQWCSGPAVWQLPAGGVGYGAGAACTQWELAVGVLPSNCTLDMLARHTQAA